jgi:hypothetical protein
MQEHVVRGICIFLTNTVFVLSVWLRAEICGKMEMLAVVVDVCVCRRWSGGGGGVERGCLGLEKDDAEEHQLFERKAQMLS